jgi:hypothetical protein
VAMNAEWGARRRWATWANVLLQCVLLLGLLSVVSLLARAHARRFDLTSQGTFSISSATEDLLRHLPHELTIWLSNEMYATSQDRSLGTAVDRTLQLLREFELRNPGKIKLRVVSRDGADAEFRKHWPTVQPATVYLLANLGSGRVNKKAVEVYQLYHGDHATGALAQYRGEPVLSQAVRDLAGATRRVVYETEGHGEVPTADQRQLGVFKELLARNEGVEIKRLALADVKSVPPDCDVLCVFGPSQPFSDYEVGVLKDYLERGGSLLVALRPRVKNGLEAFLEEYGVKVGDNLVLDPAQSSPANPSHLLLRDFNAHDINQGMAGLTFLMADSCTVDPIERNDASWRIVPLVMTGPTAWEETGPTGPGTRPKADGKERVGDLKLIVAVEKPAARPLDEHHKKARLIVWGSVSPFTNPFFSSRASEYQWTYIVNHFRWLADRRLLEIEHAKVDVTPLDLSAAALTRLRWVVHAGFPAFGLALGVLAWFLRRK